jgi:CYTH domain-containing protein
MPIERELKYVLEYSEALEADLRKQAAIENNNAGGQVYAYGIYQGYLQKGSRVRKLAPALLPGVASGLANECYMFTYKQKLSDRPGVLEIEARIEAEDFELAWHEAERKLYKIRVVVPMGEFKFEIDHFYKTESDYLRGEEPYLVLAEVELPQQYNYTPSDVRLHPIVQKHLLLAVPEGDNRFSNRKLGDRDYVAKVLSEIQSAKSAA